MKEKGIPPLKFKKKTWPRKKETNWVKNKRKKGEELLERKKESWKVKKNKTKQKSKGKEKE